LGSSSSGRRRLHALRTHPPTADACVAAVLLAPRSETYEYYKLPYCKPGGGVKYKTLRMGEVVDANRMATTPFNLSFKVDRPHEVVCEKSFSGKDMEKFRRVRQLSPLARAVCSLHCVCVCVCVCGKGAAGVGVGEGVQGLRSGFCRVASTAAPPAACCCCHRRRCAAAPLPRRLWMRTGTCRCTMTTCLCGALSARCGVRARHQTNLGARMCPQPRRRSGTDIAAVSTAP
jgi:hypothetical protein